MIILLTNNIYLQFLTSTLLIIIGILQLFFAHIYPFLSDLKMDLTNKINNKNFRVGVSLFLENKLIVEIIFFSFVFWIVILIDTIIYFAVIKKKYNTRYNLKNWKMNLWKIIYLVFIFFIFANIFSVFFVLLPKIKKKSIFNKVVVETRLENFIKKKNKYNIFFSIFVKSLTNKKELKRVDEIWKDSWADIEEAKNHEEKKEIVIDSIRKIRKETKEIYNDIKESKEFKKIKLDRILDSDQPLIEEKEEINKFLKILGKNYEELMEKTDFSNRMSKEEKEAIKKFIEKNQEIN